MTILKRIRSALGTDKSPFLSLGLAKELCSNVASVGYRELTPIQKAAIPHVLKGRDVLGCAQTGTGKTAAFALPILHGMLSRPSRSPRRVIRTLVLAPTRELAAQIAANFEVYGARTGLRQALIFGGVKKGAQCSRLRGGVDIVVATPGRLLDLVNDGALSLQHVEAFVLDEADRMLDMGFIRDVQKVIRLLPKDRQTLLFSATMPTQIQELARRTLRSPAEVAVDPISSTRKPILQSVLMVEKRHKIGVLLKLLGDRSVESALVFTRTKRQANRVAEKLVAAGVRAAAIHGNKSQAARERSLQGFKEGRLRILVATDIAARGIDVKGLSHVFNFEMPDDPESYVHRVGRTGRAGAGGTAVSLCAHEELPKLNAIERLTKSKLKRSEAPQPAAEPSAPQKPQPRSAERDNSARPRRRRRRR